MSRRRLKALALIAALLAATGLFGVSGAVSSTQAAWSDRVNFAAPVSAGTWLAPNTCIAWTDAEKKNPVSCTITSITMSLWGNGPRSYRVFWKTETGQQPYWTEFAVDLSSMTPAADDSAWSWSGATVQAGARFTPIDGWTCAALPIVRGQSSAWNTDVEIVVQPKSITGATMCG